VLSPALLIPGARAVQLEVGDAAAPTFHGRDVFAPAAAALAHGASLDELGEPFPDPIIRRTPEPRRIGDGTVEGEIMTIDRFGNCVTNLLAPRGGTCSIGDRSLGDVRRTYADVPPGAAAVFIGSTGLVEVAVREGHAASELGLRRGDRIVLRPPRP
jgi:S-adenosylmethionine hydrolase